MKQFKTLATAFFLALGMGVSHANAADTISGQYIVTLDEAALGQTPVLQSVNALVASIGGAEVMYVYDTALTGFAAKLPRFAVRALGRSPLVLAIEPDQMVYANATQFNPPSYGLDRVDQRNLPLDDAYSYPDNAGAGANVYVLDTGLNASHIDFAGRVGTGANFAANGGSILCDLLGLLCPAPEPGNTDDCNGHGTHVSGTAVGSSYGVAKSAKVFPVRVLGCGGSGSNAGVIAGVDWVAANHEKPAVANMSLGGGNSEALDTAVRNAIAAGVAFAVAAGNDNADACSGSPNRVAEAITVGSTTSSDARSSFSNFGSCLDIYAPGSNIISASHSSDTGATSLSGTSMAAPHVAGAAARYLAANPAATPDDVVNALTANATAGVVGDAKAGSPNLLLYVSPTTD